jgi:ketosteroid isomerase-like protein
MPSAAASELTRQLETLNRMWMAAYVNRDIEFLDQHVADDYVSTFPDGAVLDKKGEIDALLSGAVTLSEMHADEMTVRVYGSTAVITGQSTIKAKVQGRDESGQFRFTDVWVKQRERWLAVASQVTRIASP